MLSAIYAPSFVIFSTALGYVCPSEMGPRKGKLLAWGTRLVPQVVRMQTRMRFPPKLMP